MSNEIKVGDKVRVREDAPTSYLLRIKRNNLYAYYKVYDIEGEMAFINLYPKGLSLRDLTSDIVIPTKYLIKVEEEEKEAKEAKFHKGDRVKFKNIYELQKVKDKSFQWMLAMFASKEATITAVEDNGFYRVDIDPSIGGINDDMIECKVEPTEAEKKPNVGSIKIPVEVDLTDSYWDAYTADLAKEIAVKVANKYSDPKQAAEYAVKVAKAVVEGLKRK